MNITTSLRTVLSTSLLLAVTGCGGGGGGSDAPAQTPAPNPTPPTNPTPPAPTPSFTADNGEDVLGLALSATEGMLQLGQAALNATNRLIQNNHLAVSAVCSNSGTLVVDYTDADNSNAISAGDTVTIDFQHCFDSAINDIGDGRMVLKVVQMNSYSTQVVTMEANLAFEDDFRVDTPEGDVGVAGGYLLQYSAQGGSRQIVAESSNAQPWLELTVDDYKERFSAFEVQQSRWTPTSYEVEIELDSQSEVFDTSYRCRAPELLGAVNATPTQGVLTCTASDNSAARINAATSQLQVDADGNQAFEHSASSTVFADAVEGYLFGANPP